MWLRILVLGALVLPGCVPAGQLQQPPAALAQPAASPLAVAAVVPEPNASAVAFDTPVFVQFNRPVVPLTTLDRPPDAVPLRIEPPVDGSGRWISTGLYTFTPSVGWAPATAYRLTVPSTDYVWSFTTLAPAVASTDPPPSATMVDPAAPLRITFNQPLDPATVQLHLTPGAEGATTWANNRTLVLRPAAALPAGTTFEARINLSAAAQPYVWHFSTAPEPSVTRSIPQDGAEAPRLGQIELFFSAPMDRDDVRANLKLAPELDYAPFVKWTDDDTHAVLYAPFQPETRYAVSLAAGTHDRFGRPTAGPFSIQFRTPAGQNSPSAPPVAPQAWLVSPGPVGTYNAYDRPRALVRTTNVSHFDYSLDALDEVAVLELHQSLTADRMPDGRRVTRGSIDVQSERNVPIVTPIDLAQLEPGYYRLRIEPKEPTKVPDHLLVVTRTMLAIKESSGQLLVWANDLRGGQPLPNLPVRVLRTGAANPIARGTTDADGILQVDVPPASPPTRTLAIVDRPGDATLALSAWNGGVGAWTFGLPVNDSIPPPFVAEVYSDRPIYRPGQTVHLKGIVRADDDAHYRLPPRTFSASWQAQDSQGRVITSGAVDRLSEFGTFDTSLDLSSEAATGTYTLALKTGDKPLASTTFLVADYQRQELEVNLERLSEVVAHQSLRPTLHAAYYFGQPLAAADVHWQVSAEPFSFKWSADPSFRFGDWDQQPLKAVGPPANAPRAEGKGTTTSDGSFTFEVPSALGQQEQSQRFTIEASVEDPQRGQVSNRASVVVHKAGVYLGLKPTTFVAQAGRQQSIELVTLGLDGSPRPNVDVHVQVVRRRWLSVRERDAQGELRWTSHAQDTPAGDFNTRSGSDGRGSFEFTPPEGGEYRLIVEAPDDMGNTAHTAIGVWVAGAGFVPWRIDDDGRLELKADKSEYRPGEVAHVIVPAPIADANALVSVERGKLISHALRRLGGNSAVLDIPIGAEHVPNAYVSVVLFGGGKSPEVYTGYLELSVSSSERQLQVSIQPDRREHAPGDTVSVTLHTRDSDGRGVPAEVSLALVDAGVLALADSHSDAALAFWRRRPLGVRTGTSLGVSIDRMNASASTSGRKGGGGGEQASVRQDFPDTAFWAPAVRTGATGEARVDVHLPDTLTRWRLTAVAVTPDTRLGVATSDVVTSKPLLVRPLTPRFLVAGDVARVGAAIHNTTTAALSVTASLHADGVLPQDDTQRSIDIPPGGQARVEWGVSAPVSGSPDGSPSGISRPDSRPAAGEASGRVPEPATAKLRFQASGPGVSDAVEAEVPLLAWGAPTTVATAGEVAAADTLTETVDLPKDADPHRGELAVQVSPSLAAALRYSLQQVEEYPYECLEQTVSRFLPRLALARALNGSGLSDPLNLKAELPGLVSRSIQRLYRFQHADGGWGWWQDDSSQPYLTAYAIFGLLEAHRAGFAVDQDVIKRGATYLRQWLNADPGAFGLDTRAFVVYVLGQAGAPDPSRVATLFDRRADLGPTARGYLAQALAAIDPDDGRIGGLLAEITSAAVVSATGAHWEETNASAKPWIMGTDVRTTAGVLDALVRLRPSHPLVSSAVRWLMAARRDQQGYWETTHDTSMSLLALTDYLSEAGELQGSFQWQVGFNGHTLENGSVAGSDVTASETRVAIPVPQLEVGPNRVEFIRSVGPGRLYYSLQLRTFAQGGDIPFISHGFILGREYRPVGGASPVSELHAGDLVQVRLTLIAPSDLHDVVIEDPLPAGLEALDTRLKTTSVAIAAAARTAQTPGWQPWTHVDVRATNVALFASLVPRGAYQYTYLARANLPGEYHVLPVQGHEQYFPEIFARGDGRRFTVLP